MGIKSGKALPTIKRVEEKLRKMGACEYSMDRLFVEAKTLREVADRLRGDDICYLVYGRPYNPVANKIKDLFGGAPPGCFCTYARSSQLKKKRAKDFSAIKLAKLILEL